MNRSDTAPPLVVVMGVSGTGKSTVGAGLATALGVHFIDADDLHPLANVQKMASGTPLTDTDRWPWLADVGRTLRDYETTGLVIACSALRRIYRNIILWEAPGTLFVHLQGEHDLIQSRLTTRNSHFMPPALLTSQLETLEPLAEHEPGFSIDINAPLETIISEAHRTITNLRSWVTRL